MNKKLTMIVFAGILGASAAFALTSCDLTKYCPHSLYGDWTVTTEATCTEAGEKTRTCKICGNAETQEIAALGHKAGEEWAHDENGHWHVCVREGCGAEVGKESHADEDEDGACDVCGVKSVDLIRSTVAALVGDGTKDSVDVKLTLSKNAGSDVFAAIVEGLEKAKDGSVNLTIGGAETIPEEAFESCYALGGVTLGAGVKTIDKNAFNDARYMTSLAIGDDVTDIGNNAFMACYDLADVTFGKKVENIGGSAFDSTDIKSIVLPDSVKTLGWYTFGYCSSLEKVVLSKNIETIPTNVFYSTAIKSIVIPDGVTTLEVQAFGACHKLENIVIPDSVTSIGEQLFTSNEALKSITFGKGVTKLAEDMFYYCQALEEITFSSPIVEVQGNTFYNEKSWVPAYNLKTENVTLTFAKGQKTLEKNGDGKWVATENGFTGGTTFCGSTFKGIVIAPTAIDASGMTKEDLQAKIGELIAADTTNISVKLAANAGSDIFGAIVAGLADAQDGSVNLTISGAEKIPDEVFVDNTKLKSVTIGKGVKTIGLSVFGGSSLTSVQIGADVEVIGSGAFGFSAITKINIPDNVTTIGKSIFSHCYFLTSVTIGKGISTIPECAFYKCTELKNITIPSNITTVEKLAFAGSGLTSVMIPDTVTSLGIAAFSDCKALASVTIGSGITTIESQTFKKCTALESITIPSTVKSIDESAFSGSGLTSVTVPDSVTSIGDNAFSACESLTSITIGKGVTKMSKNVFNSDTALTEIIFCGVITEAEYLIFNNFTTANVTLTLVKGQKILAGGDDENPWTATSDDFTSGNEFCGSTFKKIILPIEIDTREMSTEQIEAAVAEAVENGAIDLTIKFKSDAGVEEFNAVCQAIQFSNWEECLNLTVTGVTEISTTVFYNYGWLKSITFGDGITTLGGEYTVMNYCGSLECATIGKSVKAINGTVFYDCEILEKIVYEGTVAEWNAISKVENWVKECPSVTEIVCLDGTVAL